MIDDVEKELYENLIKQPSIDAKNELIYTAGYTGHDFFDLSKLVLSSKTSENVVIIYEKLLNKLKLDHIEFNKLAFSEKTIGPLSISSELSRRRNLDCIIVKTRVPCSCKLCSSLRIKGSLEPPLSKDDKVVIVSDVFTTGGTILDTINIIETNRASVVGAIMILDRQMPDKITKREMILKKGVKLYPYITRDRLLSLGFARPSEEDLERVDFLELLKDAMGLSVEEADLARNYFDFLADKVLKNKKDTNEASKKFTRNMLISIAVSARVNKTSILEKAKQEV